MYKSLFIIQVPLTLCFSSEFKSVCTKCTSIPRFRGFSASYLPLLHFLFTSKTADKFTLFKDKQKKKAFLHLEYETWLTCLSRMALEVRPVQNLQLSHANTFSDCVLVHVKHFELFWQSGCIKLKKSTERLKKTTFLWTHRSFVALYTQPHSCCLATVTMGKTGVANLSRS